MKMVILWNFRPKNSVKPPITNKQIAKYPSYALKNCMKFSSEISGHPGDPLLVILYRMEPFRKVVKVGVQVMSLTLIELLHVTVTTKVVVILLFAFETLGNVKITPSDASLGSIKLAVANTPAARFWQSLELLPLPL